jgi:phosphate transport system permease protein
LTTLSSKLWQILFGRAGYSEVRSSDFAFVLVLRLLAIFVIGIFCSIVVFLYLRSQPILARDGFRFFLSQEWSPGTEEYGALPFVYGTLVTSFVALIIAVPISLGSSIFLTELAPNWIARPVGFLIEMLAAIPSVVYGLWGIFVLAPFVREWIQPVLGRWFHWLPLFQGAPFGIGIFTASLILAVMILPTITAVCREVFMAIPTITREGALSLGATRWETIRLAVIQTAIPGILSAVILGLGRAMGETMAVTMLIGNRAVISSSLFSPGATMASVIANEYPEASSDLHLSALTAIGLTLFLVSLVVNGMARAVIAFYRRRFH